MSRGYPFNAIVGQELLKKALLLAAIDPTIGGVLIRGDKGTAKSTAARGLAELLPPIEAVVGCAFNCEAQHPLSVCDVCTPDERRQFLPVPFITLPLGATEDRVLGTLDFERALKEGKQKFLPGLLASAHRGVLYIDEVNLLADHLVDVLLDAAAMGVNTVQREGLSVEHPSRVTLIGTMNPEEGDLRPQLLDRFGMMVEVAAPREPLERSAVVRSRLSFEADPAAFRSVWQASQDDSRRTLERAMAALPHIEITDSLIDVISAICCRLEIVSLRADIVMTKVVRALAALDGRRQPNSEDVKVAALLVLAHRKRVNPLDKTGLDEELLDETLQGSNWDKPNGPPENAPPQSPPQSESESESESDYDLDSDSDPDFNSDSEPLTDDQGAESNSPPLPPLVFSASAAYQFKAGLKLDGANSRLSGLRGRLKGGTRGRYVRAVQDNKPASLAVDATIRHAVIHSNSSFRSSGEFRVGSENLHAKVRVEQKATLVILLVDASGSMAAMRRMEAVKGAALSLLEDAYRKRDQVCVIAFRGAQAEVLLPPTRSMQIANQALQVLPTGGRTPLAHGLSLALNIACESRLKAHLEPLLVVLTDGKGNVSLPEHDNAQASALALAAQIAERKVAALVVDTEDGYIKVGLARPLAAAMGAEYLGLEKLSADKLTLAIKGHGRGPGNG